VEAYYDLVRRLARGFEKAHVEYAFTGALAASFYGASRTTVDVDVVVEVATGKGRAGLISALKSAGLVVDEREVERAFESGYGIARLRDSKTAYTVDVILSASKLAKRAGSVGGVRVFFQAPEDLVLAKLRMIKATVPRERAVKDEEDVKAILKFAKVDVDDIRKRAKKKSTLPLFESLVSV